MSQPKPTNPFAYRRKRWFEYWRAWILAAVVAGVTVAVLLPEASRQFLLSQLTTEIDNLPSDVRSDRMKSIGKLGLPGIPTLVNALSHSDRSTAKSAFDALTQQQQAATEKDQAAGLQYHRHLIDQLVTHIDAIPENRWAWAKSLANQALMDSLNTKTLAGDAVHRDATTLLARLSTIPTPSLPAPPRSGTPVQVAQIPVTLNPTPQAQPDLPLGPQPNSGAGAFDTGVWVDPSTETSKQLADSRAPSANPLQPAMILRGQAVETSQRLPAETDTLAVGDPPSILNAESRPSGGPLTAYSTRAVIDLLESVRPQFARAAKEELIARGFSQEELGLAIRLASSNASVRISLVDEIPHRSDVDPRTWLLWLADDGERSVRLRAFAALGTMDDPNVVKRLRELLISEQDPSVASQIRQALLR